jgi:hypothetical protein
MSEGKILVTGVGGCGSSFVWSLLGACGLSNGGINEYMRHKALREAMKTKTADNWEFPRLIKHLGGFMCNLNEHVDRHGWEVEHVFLCMTSYELQMKKYYRRGRVPVDQREAKQLQYEQSLGQVLIQLNERDHPFTVIRSPRSIKDVQYCYDKMRVVLGGMAFEEFKEIHQGRIIPRLLKRLDGYA